MGDERRRRTRSASPTVSLAPKSKGRGKVVRRLDFPVVLHIPLNAAVFTATRLVLTPHLDGRLVRVASTVSFPSVWLAQTARYPLLCLPFY